jgi:hypothetical protein
MKPHTVIDYNDTMGGVQLADWHLSNYPVPMKQGKKYKNKTFIFVNPVYCTATQGVERLLYRTDSM